MRRILLASAVVFAGAFAVMPSQAQQGGEYMWCTAWTDNGTEKAYFYSAFFAAGAWEAERKALKFKSEIEDKKLSAAPVKAACMPPAVYDTAVASRNAAMKSAPGKVLGWEG